MLFLQHLHRFFKVSHVHRCRPIHGFLPLPSRKQQKSSTKLPSTEKSISSTDSRKTLSSVTSFRPEQATAPTKNLLSVRKTNTKSSSLRKKKRWKKKHKT